MTITQPKILYSEDLETFISNKYSDYVLHAICTSGKGKILFDNRPFEFCKNNILVIAHPHKISDYEHSEDLHLEIIGAPLNNIINVMPPNHYGVGGSVWWYKNPIIPISEEQASWFVADIQNIRCRLGHTHHNFHQQLISSLLQTMQYDMFDAHVCHNITPAKNSHPSAIVHSLIDLLGTEVLRTHREVTYYAEQLHVSPSYLTETVRSITGHTVIELITQRTIPLIIEYIKDPRLSLTQISDEMNFSSLNYFTRYVRKHLGMTPTELRAKLFPRNKVL